MTQPISKPLVRWTIGNVTAIGYDILRESVLSFASIYPEFDRVVCYNHIGRDRLGDLPADLFAQRVEDAPCALAEPIDSYEESTGCGWKLCPPRLRPEVHELWLDNDVLVVRRLSQIDDWLNGDYPIITEGLGRCRMFGVFDSLVPSGLHVCAGLFGLPPSFDFAAAIRDRIHVMGGAPVGGYNEQGLTASVVTNTPGFRLIPNDTVFISEDHTALPNHLYPAYHFAGANRKGWHRGWQAYRRLRAGVLMT